LISLRKSRNLTEHPGGFIQKDDNEAISTCSPGDSNQGAPNLSLYAQNNKQLTTGGLLDKLDDYDSSIDFEDGDEVSLDLAGKDGTPIRRSSVSRPSSINANAASITAHSKMHDSHQLLLEAALACWEGTAWCTKSLAQEALEQSVSHLSRANLDITRW
jgi:hypothetical protein